MAQWSHWDLVSSRLGQDQRNFWKAVDRKGCVRAGYQHPGLSLYCCGWTAVALAGSSQRECCRTQTAGSAGVCVCAKWITAVTEQKCTWQPQSIILIRALPLLKSSWKEVLESTDRPVKTYSGRETPSRFLWQNSLWLPSGAPTMPHPLHCWSRTKVGQQKVDHSSLLLQAMVNNAICTTLEEN